jgi:hypothetical protein
MTTLHDLEQQLHELEEIYLRGEISEEAFRDTFESLALARDQKIANLIRLIETYEAYAGNCKEAAFKLLDKRETWLKRAESRKKLLAFYLPERGWTDGAFSAHFHTSSAVEGDDISGLPEEFIRTTTLRKPDRVALRRSMEAGASYPNFQLVKTKSVVIR